MGKYLPHKGKVGKNYECLMALVIFVNFSLLANVSPCYPQGDEIYSTFSINTLTKMILDLCLKK